MRITAIHEQTVKLEGNIANAVVDFSSHTVSLVAVVSDQIRYGKPVTGFAFNSIGRFAQAGILKERMIPRVLNATPASLLTPTATAFSPAAVLDTAMKNEKPGGHGDRAGAAAALELAIWDLNAKLADEPAYIHIARSLGCTPVRGGTPVYAAGGYYYPKDSIKRLVDEICAYRDLGYQAFKIKIGGAPLNEDLARIEAAIEAADGPQNIAVDANGRFDLVTALEYGAALQAYGLRWYEEPGDPLDYELMAQLCQTYQGPVATGENLFSTVDTKNLTAFGGLRSHQDVLQMDPGLSYGLTEYLDMLDVAARAGFERKQCIPHGGHLINLHIVTGLGLGGCEAYPGVFQPFGGYSPQCVLADGCVTPSDAPGFGLEEKSQLAPYLQKLSGN
jgi:D(-)-tartrate dehydratase